MPVKETEMCSYRVSLGRGQFRCLLSGATGLAGEICEKDSRNSNDCAEKLSAKAYAPSGLTNAIKRAKGNRKIGK